MEINWLDMHVAISQRCNPLEFEALLKQLPRDVSCEVINRFIERALLSETDQFILEPCCGSRSIAKMAIETLLILRQISLR